MKFLFLSVYLSVLCKPREATLTSIAFEEIRYDPDLDVEGCEYVLLLEDKYEETLNFYIDHFLPDEPVGRSASLELNDEYEGLVMSELEDNISIGLVSKATGELIGFRIMNIMNKANCEVDTRDTKYDKLKLVQEFHDCVARLNNVYEYYGVEDVIELCTICVHRDRRKDGVGSKLMKTAIKLVASLGLGPVVVTGIGSSNYSKKIFEKFGFDTLAEVKFDEYKVNGEVVFKNLGEHKCERLYGKVVH